MSDSIGCHLFDSLSKIFQKSQLRQNLLCFDRQWGDNGITIIHLSVFVYEFLSCGLDKKLLMDLCSLCPKVEWEVKVWLSLKRKKPPYKPSNLVILTTRNFIENRRYVWLFVCDILYSLLGLMNIVTWLYKENIKETDKMIVTNIFSSLHDG